MDMIPGTMADGDILMAITHPLPLVSEDTGVVVITTLITTGTMMDTMVVTTAAVITAAAVDITMKIATTSGMEEVLICRIMPAEIHKEMAR